MSGILAAMTMSNSAACIAIIVYAVTTASYLIHAATHSPPASDQKTQTQTKWARALVTPLTESSPPPSFATYARRRNLLARSMQTYMKVTQVKQYSST